MRWLLVGSLVPPSQQNPSDKKVVLDDLNKPNYDSKGIFRTNFDRVRSGKKSTVVKKVHRYLSYLNSHQVMWYHFLHQGKNPCQNPFSH